jgi:hypothetical protein
MKNVPSIFSEEGKKKHRHYATAIYLLITQATTKSECRPAPEPIKEQGVCGMQTRKRQRFG